MTVAKSGLSAATLAFVLYWNFVKYPQEERQNFLQILHASSDGAIPPEYPWSHKGYFDSYDAASIRRGYQVYRQVCSACHGMTELAFRNLDVAFTKEEIKTLAADVDVEDGPNENGEMYTRPAKPFDRMAGPYKNEQEARRANGGALPPDLSIIVKARPHGEDYIFSLLTGYDEPPAGVNLREGLYFNAYFPGGAIGMAPPISDGAIEYEDGTPATLSQMSKDVVTYLSYCAQPDLEARKKTGLKVILSLVLMSGFTYYYKRFRFAQLKSRQLKFSDQ